MKKSPKKLEILDIDTLCLSSAGLGGAALRWVNHPYLHNPLAGYLACLCGVMFLLAAVKRGQRQEFGVILTSCWGVFAVSAFFTMK